MHAIYMYVVIITKEVSPEEIEDNNNNNKKKKQQKQGTMISCEGQIQVMCYNYITACSIQIQQGKSCRFYQISNVNVL